MAKIVTLTLNPSLDKSTSVPFIKPDAKLRCQTPKFEPGGGGINVSRAIKKLGGESLAIFLNGGFTGVFYEELIQKESIPYFQIQTKEATRENFIVVNESTQEQMRFGLPGAFVNDKEWRLVLETIKNLKEKPDYLVASGSLCPGIPEDFYAELGEICRFLDIKYILDASGKSLSAAVESGLFLIKPNLGELADLSGIATIDGKTLIESAKRLIGEGKCQVVVVSLGPAGAMLVSKDVNKYVSAPLVKKKSTVGAGDSMVAGMVWALTQNKSLEEMIQLGVACGTAATLNEGTELCRKEDVDQLFDWIKHQKEINPTGINF
jgi:6-phosphofructokinase 2